jgi:hypothetical protein
MNRPQASSSTHDWCVASVSAHLQQLCVGVTLLPVDVSQLGLQLVDLLVDTLTLLQVARHKEGMLGRKLCHWQVQGEDCLGWALGCKAEQGCVTHTWHCCGARQPVSKGHAALPRVVLRLARGVNFTGPFLRQHEP